MGVGAGRRRYRSGSAALFSGQTGEAVGWGGVGKDLGWSLLRELHKVGLAWLAGCGVSFFSPSFLPFVGVMS